MDDLVAQDVRLPKLGLGTYGMKAHECREACLHALELGYRHFDTAQMYNNEGAVGEAVRESRVPRDEIFVTTKILRKNLSYEDLHSSFEKSLERLGLDGLDLLLIHAPSRTVPIEESIGAMNELQEQGLVHHIGVSNFTVDQTREAMDVSSTPIVTNQVKYHPFKPQNELLEFCVENNLALTAYTPLANSRVSRNETLREIGELYQKSPQQIALRWLVQQPMVCTIPKSSDPEHQADNLNVFDFELTQNEMERIFELGGGLINTVRNLLNF